MSNKLFTLVVILLVLITLVVVSADKNDSPADKISQMIPRMGGDRVPTVAVDAYESKKFEANEFKTMASLELRGKDKELLSKQLTSRRNSIFEQMKGLDISESDIELNSVEMRKEWSYDKGTHSLTGYVISQSFFIKSYSRATAAAVISSLTTELDVEINRTMASLKEADSLKREAILAVGKSAIEKAKNYAESVGGKLGKVVAVRNDDGKAVAYTRNAGKMYSTLLSADAVSLASVADSVEISASIYLEMELLQE